ncbi:MULTISPECIES: DUF3197 domain-containing protein [unclassified Meiothermus]|uniref:DUF3197 domain-containing protein n=1 Tax=unclassified Meiothermus TaxID=370471 RepID=UPI000D7CC992|nr:MULTISPECIES: DUF3197 domain-containing protein [unclassified Meiothermus]PZA07882.1 DUF3197 domain-containing protein [Meiothermus sp. Pnk-1]RYM38811.1 DUF3197 domain-containing protein [Meiothermus sp. PNK-Is4]
MEVIGLRGAPQHTLEALQEALKGARFPELIVTFVTDWQDQRNKARYAVFVRSSKHSLLTMDAFGPAFGPEGDQALSELVHWLEEKGVHKWYESVVPPSEYAALFETDPDEVHRQLVANANPSDPALYTHRGYTSRM